jgi:hypothetical protein
VSRAHERMDDPRMAPHDVLHTLTTITAASGVRSQREAARKGGSADVPMRLHSPLTSNGRLDGVQNIFERPNEGPDTGLLLPKNRGLISWVDPIDSVMKDSAGNVRCLLGVVAVRCARHLVHDHAMMNVGYFPNRMHMVGIDGAYQPSRAGC